MKKPFEGGVLFYSHAFRPPCQNIRSRWKIFSASCQMENKCNYNFKYSPETIASYERSAVNEGRSRSHLAGCFLCYTCATGTWKIDVRVILLRNLTTVTCLNDWWKIKKVSLATPAWYLHATNICTENTAYTRYR